MSSENKTVRTHFSKSRMEIEFPHWLLFHRYVLDEWESKLILSPDHVNGEKVSSVDLRYWDNLHAVMGVISSNGIELREMDLSGNAGADSKCLAQATRLFGKTLDSLILSGCPSIDETALAFLGGMSNLQSLDISDVLHLQDYHVEKLLDYNLRQLKNLNISGCIQLTNKSLEAVSRQRNRIKSLLANTNINYTWPGVVDLLYNCEALDVVDFSNCPNIKFFGCITRLSHHPLDRDLKQFVSRSFKSVKLDGCVDINEDSLDYICGALLELEEVSLAYITAVSDPAVQALATGCPNLRKLHVQGCKGVQHEAVKILGSSIGACAENLLDINIANVGKFKPEAMAVLLRGCVNLKYLNASNNAGVVDSVFSELEMPPMQPGGAPEPIMLPNMERLSLACTGLTSFGVACLAERCVNLNHLDVSQHKHITDACLSVIAGCCRQLKSLWLNDCPALTDRGMLQIAYNCKRLEVLHLSSSVRYTDAWQSRYRQYTDVVVEAIFDGLRCLKELSLRYQCDIRLKSPWLLTEFSRRGGHQFLEKIDLRGVDELSLEGAAVVFQHCSELCFCILSPEEAVAGVTGEKFWRNAFAGCLYTASHQTSGARGEGSIATATGTGTGANGLSHGHSGMRGHMLGSSLETASVVSSGAAKESIFVPVTLTNEGTKFHSSIESGRFSSDDGTASVISAEHRRLIEAQIMREFKLATGEEAVDVGASSRQDKSRRGKGRAAGGNGGGGGGGGGGVAGRGEGARSGSRSGGSRPGTSHSQHQHSEEEAGAGAVESGERSVASFGQESVASLIEKVHSMTEFSTGRKQGLERVRTAEGGSPSKAGGDASSSSSSTTPQKLVPAGYLALAGHPERKKFRYRDFYIRRMLEEQSCIRFIQFKYKLWALWQRLRKKVSARRIANTYSLVLERRKLALHVKAMARINAARRIQRYFKFKKMPYVHASVKIQKIYRGHRCKGLLLRMARGEWAAVIIQKLMRGVLIRTSPGHIVRQIHMKLPPFWRQICGYKNPDGVDEAVKKKLFLHQVSDAKEESRRVVLKITQEVLRDGILAPQLPIIVAQPFDKKPYASVNDGRKIAVYSHTEGILWNDTGKTTKRMLEQKAKRMHRLKYDAEGNDLTKQKNQKNLTREDKERLAYLASLEDVEPEHASMHQYNIKFWPHTKPLHLPDTSTEQHDPMVNNFDHLASERIVLFCEVCRVRLRIIHCGTCMRGYCFYCAFRTHTDPGRRKHEMKLIEPRVVHEAQVGKSLIFHLDMAQQASHDLKYLVKYMRSKGEVQRLQAEKKMAKEFEEAEEQRRRAFLMAQSESNDKHSAATEISLLYRTKKARRIVREKRKQLALEKVTREESQVSPRWVTLQVEFRVWSTRNMMKNLGSGYVYRLDGKRKGKRKIGKEAAEVPKEVRVALNKRIAYEAAQRRDVERRVMMDKLIRAHSDLVCVLDANVEYWLHVDEHIPAEIEHAEEHKQLVSAEHEEESQKTAKLKGELPPEEYEVFEAKLDSIWKKVECATLRLDNFKNMRWWIAQHLRNAYRRRAAIKARLTDTIERLKWNLVESAIIGRVEVQCDARVAQFMPILGMGMATAWLQRNGEHPKVLQATLDAQQETILLEELSRLERDRHLTMEFDSLMEELYLGLNADNRLAAERVYLDVTQLAGGLEPGSEEALRVASGLVSIKRKQAQLNDNVLDTLKLGFQSKLNDEDDRMMTQYAFPEDDPDLDVRDFFKITAELLDPFSHPHHFKISTFMSVYFVQPWMADEAVKDVRLEEGIRRKQLEKGHAEEELKGVKTTISDNDEKSVTLRKQITELEHELEARSNIEDGDEETEEEREERMALINTMNIELTKKSGELDVCIEVNAKIKESIEPLGKKVEEKALEVAQMEAQLQARLEERDRLKGMFFATEKKESHDLFEAAMQKAAAIEKKHAEVQQKHTMMKHLLQESAETLQGRLDNGRWMLNERDLFGLPLGSVVHKVQDLLADKLPRTTCRYTHQLKTMVKTRMAFLEADLKVLEEVKVIIEEEEESMNNFEKEIPRYQKAVDLFIAKLVAARRQKSMQVEIVLRKKRLGELREIRMRQLKEAKEKLETEAKEAEEAKKKKAAKRVPLSKRVAAAVKSSIRGAKDFIDEIRHSAETAMDQEEIRMMQNLRKNQGNADAKPEAIRKLHITRGPDETESFGQQQRALEDRGIPFYVRVERSFGSQFYLWYQNTFDNKQMITNIEFCSSIEGEPTYKDPDAQKKDKWEGYGHHDLKMIMWVKRDVTKIKAFKEFEVSVSLAEENRNLIDGFEKFESCLDQFGLPEMYLWHKKIDKIAVNTQLNSDEIIAEVEKTREMLKKNPGDRNMQAHMDRLVEMLKKAYETEKRNIVTNPLRQIVDLLSLKPPELEVWMQIFSKIDTQREGAITFDQIFEFFEETPTLFARHVFTHMDAVDEYGTVEFGDFVRAVGTFCFFGKVNMLQFLFHFADKDKAGTITHAQFVTLLNSLNPFDKSRAKRALQELQMIPNKEMKFEEFARLHDEFPNIMHPAFRLQHAMRTKILGDDWWFDKLSKYKGVRHKMTLSSGNVDKMAEREMERFKADEAKVRRMKERDIQIRNEPSSVRKALLQARQMMDEFS